MANCFDEDPLFDSDDKCDFCEVFNRCTGRKKNEEKCFEDIDLAKNDVEEFESGQ